MAKNKVKPTTKPIVESYLERISQNVFKDFSSVITELIKGHQGIYALYKRDKLYYIGLASNLKNRIKHHLNDKHKNFWTHFSLYIIRKQEHIKEFESVILRIAYPKGNSVKGKLVRAKNLRPLLKKKLIAEWEKQLGILIGTARKITKTKNVKKISKTKQNRPLKNLFPTGKVLYANYHGKDYKAWVYRNGRIKFNGVIYDSPTMAGKSITKKALNGWKFWKYKDKNSELVYINNLRK